MAEISYFRNPAFLALHDSQNSAWRPQREAPDSVAACGAAAAKGPSHAADKPAFCVRGCALERNLPMRACCRVPEDRLPPTRSDGQLRFETPISLEYSGFGRSSVGKACGTPVKRTKSWNFVSFPALYPDLPDQPPDSSGIRGIAPPNAQNFRGQTVSSHFRPMT